MKSWNGAVSAVVAATARSTWASPSTSRRTRMPRSWAPAASAALRARSRCSAISSAAATGSSSTARCEAPSSATWRPPGTSSARSCIEAGVVTVSCSPLIASIGTASAREVGRAVERAERVGAQRVRLVVDVDEGLERATSEVAAHAVEEPGCEPARGAARDERRGAARPHGCRALGPARVRADARAAAAHDEAANAVGVRDRELERDHAAERDAGHVERAAARLVDDGEHRIGEVADRERLGRGGRGAVPGEVDAQDPQVRGARRRRAAARRRRPTARSSCRATGAARGAGSRRPARCRERTRRAGEDGS